MNVVLRCYLLKVTCCCASRISFPPAISTSPHFTSHNHQIWTCPPPIALVQGKYVSAFLSRYLGGSKTMANSIESACMKPKRGKECIEAINTMNYACLSYYHASRSLFKLSSKRSLLLQPCGIPHLGSIFKPSSRFLFSSDLLLRRLMS